MQVQINRLPHCSPQHLLQVAVVTLTRDLQSAQHLLSVLHPRADYQIIPASPHTTTHLTSDLLQTLVQQSRY